MRRPALSRRPRTGRESDGALAIARPQCRDRALIGRVRVEPAQGIGDVARVQLVEMRDRLTGIGDPEEVADAREQAGRRLTAQRSHPEQSHYPLTVARQQLLE